MTQPDQWAELEQAALKRLAGCKREARRAAWETDDYDARLASQIEIATVPGVRLSALLALIEAARQSPASDSGEGAVAWPEYTTEIGEAGQTYMQGFGEFEPRLPGAFLWYKLWDAMNKAAHPPAQGGTGG